MEHKEQVRTVVTEEHHYHCDCCGKRVETILSRVGHRPRPGELFRMYLTGCGTIDICSNCRIRAVTAYAQVHHQVPKESFCC